MRAILFLLCALAQAAEPPKFDQFSAGLAFRGTPAPARPTTKKQLLFKTQIREGAKKGSNFAGHYTIIEWGCGAGCVSGAVVDAKTGVVYSLPFDTISAAEGGSLSYQIDSRLLIARGCLNENQTSCGAYYYDWTASRFNLVQSDVTRK